MVGKRLDEKAYGSRAVPHAGRYASASPIGSLELERKPRPAAK